MHGTAPRKNVQTCPIPAKIPLSKFCVIFSYNHNLAKPARPGQKIRSWKRESTKVVQRKSSFPEDLLQQWWFTKRIIQSINQQTKNYFSAKSVRRSS